MTNAWNVEQARQRYAVPYWGENYFDIDAQGRIGASPRGPDGPHVALDDIVAAVRKIQAGVA